MGEGIQAMSLSTYREQRSTRVAETRDENSSRSISNHIKSYHDPSSILSHFHQFSLLIVVTSEPLRYENSFSNYFRDYSSLVYSMPEIFSFRPPEQINDCQLYLG